MEKYEILETIGSGSFAIVMRAKDSNTGEIVAIKKLKKKYSSWNECVTLREVRSLKDLNHNNQSENIIKLKEMILVKESLHLVFENMEKSLIDLITDRQNKKLNENQIRCILYQTLNGLAYMHKYGYFHRDLKPENLLVSGDKIKIADFGLAREIRSLPPYTDYVSTRWYRAPECLLKSTNYNSRIDIWALGCIMIELYNFKPIFIGNTEREVLFKICSILGSPPNWNEGLQLAKKYDIKFPISAGLNLTQVVPDASQEAISLLYEMLVWDPNKRASASALLGHRFFTNYPISNRINTPLLSQNMPSYKVENISEGSSNDLSKILEDSVGFNNCNIF
jgi:serine/threonine protein kinase